MRYLLIVLFVLFAQSLAAQSWQWGSRGGSTDNVDNTSGTRVEGVYSMVTDSDSNIYTLSSVGVNNVDVTGIPRQAWGDNTTKTDFVLASFSCDGSYRWSKIIGGTGVERVNTLSIDNQDNIYLSGKFSSCDDEHPSRIDDDIVLDDYSGSSCRLLFLAKYSKNGALIWSQFPEALVSVSTTFG